MEKYITFSVPIKKKCDDGEIITQKLRFIDSFRFMTASLLELSDNISTKGKEIMDGKRKNKN